MKTLKKYIRRGLVLLLPLLLGMFNGQCENVLGFLFYIPCDVQPTENFTGSASYHVDSGTVFINANGRIYLSFDLCRQPQITFVVPGNPRLNDVKTGYWERYNLVFGNSGTIVRSSASDPVWRAIPSPSSQNLNKACVIPMETFTDYWLAVGNAGTILVSRNNGLNWSQKSFPFNVNLRDLECELVNDTNHIRVVGDGLSAYHTTNGGATWIDDSLSLPGDLPLSGVEMSSGGPNMNAVQFLNLNTGYIGGQSAYYFKTVNGGVSYASRRILGLGDIVDLHFISVDSGFVISSTGKIMFTHNGGTNWFENTQVNGLVNSRPLNSISVISKDYGFINGSNGLLFLVARDSLLIGIHPISASVPDKYTLQQNYPNPFNPVTNIVFNMPKRGNVKLTIYDVLGNEIETLVDRELNPGTYKGEWNASSYPSGVYFCRLEAEGFTETKKMVLVK